MEINEKHIVDVIEVYRRHYKIQLTDNEARQMLKRLILLFEQLARSARIQALAGRPLENRS